MVAAQRMLTDLANFDRLRMAGAMAAEAGFAARSNMGIAHNKKGPAKAATSPDHGSHYPNKDQQMNAHSSATDAAGNASATVNDRLADAFRRMEGPINEPRIACRVVMLLATRQLEGWETLDDGRKAVVIPHDDAEALLWMLHELSDKIEGAITDWGDLFEMARGKPKVRAAA